MSVSEGRAKRQSPIDVLTGSAPGACWRSGLRKIKIPAEDPGSITDAASERSLSASKPDDAPANTARSNCPSWSMSWSSSARIEPSESRLHEHEVEYSDDTAIDEVEQGREPFARHLAAGELDDQIADRTQGARFVCHRVPPFESLTLGELKLLQHRCSRHARVRALPLSPAQDRRTTRGLKRPLPTCRKTIEVKC